MGQPDTRPLLNVEVLKVLPCGFANTINRGNQGFIGLLIVFHPMSLEIVWCETL